MRRPAELVEAVQTGLEIVSLQCFLTGNPPRRLEALVIFVCLEDSEDQVVHLDVEVLLRDLVAPDAFGEARRVDSSAHTGCTSGQLAEGRRAEGRETCNHRS